MSAAATKASFKGFISTTQDALLVFEGCRRGVLPRTLTRLSDAERKAISSGDVFVFSEDESKIKRWTDGRRWSPSRILNNFLIYRELPPQETDDSTSLDSIAESPSSTPDGLSYPDVPFGQSLSDSYGHVKLEGEEDSSETSQRALVGSLTATNRFKDGGLVKKTISVAGLHMISYYDAEDVIQGRLRIPTSVPELIELEISHLFLMAQYFRHPPKVRIGEDGVPRYVGLTDEEPVTRKPQSQQRRSQSYSTRAPGYAVASPSLLTAQAIAGVPAPHQHTIHARPSTQGYPSLDAFCSTYSPVESTRPSTASSINLARSVTSASSTSGASESRPTSPRRRTSSTTPRYEPYGRPSHRQMQPMPGVALTSSPGYSVTANHSLVQYPRTDTHTPSQGRQYRSASLSTTETYSPSRQSGQAGYYPNHAQGSSSFPVPLISDSRPSTSPAGYPYSAGPTYVSSTSYGNYSENDSYVSDGSPPTTASSMGQFEDFSFPVYSREVAAATAPDVPLYTVGQQLSEAPVTTPTHSPQNGIYQPQPQYAASFFFAPESYKDASLAPSESQEAGSYASTPVHPSAMAQASIPSNFSSLARSHNSHAQQPGVSMRQSYSSGYLSLPTTDHSPLLPSTAAYSINQPGAAVPMYTYHSQPAEQSGSMQVEYQSHQPYGSYVPPPPSYQPEQGYQQPYFYPPQQQPEDGKPYPYQYQSGTMPIASPQYQ